MDELRPGFRCSDLDRRPDIFNARNFYATNRPRSPVDWSSIPPRVPRPSQSSAPASKPWRFSDPETKRRKRIAKYKVYTVEGRIKASMRKGFRWIKNKCSEMVHGF
ncbi:hypothetical protein U1Q18_034391 [Sarracenia purpurea var. burkii]